MINTKKVPTISSVKLGPSNPKFLVRPPPLYYIRYEYGYRELTAVTCDKWS